MSEEKFRELLIEVLKFERRLEASKDGSVPLSEALVGNHAKEWRQLTIRIRRALARGATN